MAKIVLGIGSSHTPLLTIPAKDWARRAEADYANPRLNLSDGRFVTYPQLLAEVGPRYDEVITPEILAAREKACQDSLDVLADEIARVAPDVVVIVGDDHQELFPPASQPSVAIYYGDRATTAVRNRHGDAPQWQQQVNRGYMMDSAHPMPTNPAFARGLIEKLMDLGVDVAAVQDVPEGSSAGLGHAYGFIVGRLFRGKQIPIVPFLLNTYYPPNVPTSARAFDIGVALEQAIAASDPDLRVCVLASGGLSHFIVDEKLDRGVLDAVANGTGEQLRKIPRGALNSGSSEILNWILAAGTLRNMKLRWSDYQPLYRSSAGTGIGAAFAIWN